MCLVRGFRLAKMQRIPIAGPWITQQEVDYVTDAVASAWYDQSGVYNRKFEQAFAEYIGVQYAVSLPSCTAGIHLSLLALGIGPGDEVIVPDITWIASAAPVNYVGAETVFADIDPLTWCMDADSFESCITERTRAVIVVDLYGNIPDMAKIRTIARKHGIAVIEDAAQAIGSEQAGVRAGSFGDIGVFSFHGTKTLTTGEGGMLVTDKTEIFERVNFLRDHGRGGDRHFWNTEIAYKYKMGSLQAALGLAQLERIDQLIAKKCQIFSWYQAILSCHKDLTLNFETPGTKNSYWMVTLLLPEMAGIQKEAFIAQMSECNVECRPFFYPLSSLPAYENKATSSEAKVKNEVSYKISPFGVNLPSALNLTLAQVEYVCQQVTNIMALQQAT